MSSNKVLFFLYICPLHVDLLSTTSANKNDDLKSVINARALYSSCIDEEKIELVGIEPVLSLINTEFGGWPILQGSSWNSTTFDLANLLLTLRQYDYNFIFGMGTGIDEKNSSTTYIRVSLIAC